MEAGQGKYRLTGFGVVALVLVMIVGITLLLRPKTPFQREHARAEAATPEWIHVEIRTSDHRSQYRENEPIYVVPKFSSTKQYVYKIETAEGQNLSTIDTLHISNGQKFLRTNSIACCSHRLVGLDDEPYYPKATSRPLMLPPGNYEIFLTTRRIYKWDVASEEFNPSDFEVASNLLKISIIPDRR
jgi:hypothetical protein